MERTLSKPDCIFCRIVRGEIPARKVHEDEHMVAFHDIHPQAPVHLLLIPKAHIENLYDARPEDAPVLGHLMAKAGELARAQGLTDGFRLLANNGRVGGQEVYHLHLHVVGGDTPLGPMLSRRG